MLIKCPREDCPYHITGWDYRGKAEYPVLVCCPKCGSKVRVPTKKKIKIREIK